MITLGLLHRSQSKTKFIVARFTANHFLQMLLSCFLPFDRTNKTHHIQTRLDISGILSSDSAILGFSSIRSTVTQIELSKRMTQSPSFRVEGDQFAEDGLR